jgi:hypothetical protein
MHQVYKGHSSSIKELDKITSKICMTFSHSKKAALARESTPPWILALGVIIFINSPLTLTRILPDKKEPRHEIRSAPKSEH